jgi:hypothetical protein
VPTCWAILEIPPTHDVDVISKARRSLIRKWHPDTVGDAAQKNDYTIRCAAINVAHDEAVQIAETAGRIFRTNFKAPDTGADTRRGGFRRSGFDPEFTFWPFSMRVTLYVVIYIVAFRLTVPLTLFAIIFFAGALVATIVDVVLHRYLIRPVLTLLSLQQHWVVAFALLALANFGVNYYLQPREFLFELGIITIVPLWGLRLWRKEQRLRGGEATV